MSSQHQAEPGMEFPATIERFIKHAPVSVMTRLLLGNQLSSTFMDDIFQRHAKSQYTRELAFSSVTRLLSRVVFGQSSTLHAAYQQDVEELGVSVSALYQKLSKTEPAVCSALVRETAQSLHLIAQSLEATLPEPVLGYVLRTLDGNHLAATQKRLKVLRDHRPPGLPGQTLALYDHATRLISEVVVCPDAYAHERSGLKEVISCVKPGDLIMGDRSFCVKEFFEALRDKSAAFLIRHHQGMPLKRVGIRKERGKCSTGKVYEQYVRVGKWRIRAIIIVRRKCLCDSSDNNKVKQSGKSRKRTVTLLTNLTCQEASAVKLAKLYLTRWKIEEGFRRLTVDLRCEVNTLGYPQAALLCFCLAVMACNTLAALERAISQHWKKENAEQQVSFFYLAHEVRHTTAGLLIAIPDEDWQTYDQLPAPQLADLLKHIIQKMKPRRYLKRPSTSLRIKKKPPNTGPLHTSTYRLLHPQTKATWTP